MANDKLSEFFGGINAGNSNLQESLRILGDLYGEGRIRLTKEEIKRTRGFLKSSQTLTEGIENYLKLFEGITNHE